MAQRQGVKESEWMHPALIFPVLQHLALNGADTGEHVGVSMNDALGLGGGAGGEDDLKGGLRGDGFADGVVRLGGELDVQVEEPEVRNLVCAGEVVNQVGVAD